MGSLTIRSLEDGVKQRLRVRAAQNGRSMEAEVRDILRRAASEPLRPEPPVPMNLAESIRAKVAMFGGIDLELEPREPLPEPPSFD
jgi:plasmid stability protein